MPEAVVSKMETGQIKGCYQLFGHSEQLPKTKMNSSLSV